MRNRRSSKQRLWLGSGRYFGSSGRGFTNTDADCHCDSDSDRHANCQPYCNSIGNCHAATDANTQVGAIRKAAPHASSETIEFRRPDFWW